jgi:hypothetical protein
MHTVNFGKLLITDKTGVITVLKIFLFMIVESNVDVR